MSTTYKDVDVKCPYYKGQTANGISCEGLTDDSIIKLWFNSHKLKCCHMDAYCQKRYNYCEIARMLEAKYEEE